jgi:hypothetical protein
LSNLTLTKTTKLSRQITYTFHQAILPVAYVMFRRECSTPLLFAAVTFLKTPANGKTAMHEAKTSWKKLG